MENKVKFRNVDVFYYTRGRKSNPAVFLLHGYLESSEIWDGFSARLAEKYHVIAVDLPGHGKSGVIASVHEMGELAAAVKEVADHLGIQKFHLAGHSMGGYVTMAFREKYPERLLSYVLFHSHCFADDGEKKAARSREIELVKQGKKDLIVNTNIPKGFATDNLERLSEEVERAKQIALKTPAEGIIAILNGMKERPDRCHILKEEKLPLLLIAGKKDNHIPFLKMEEIMIMGKNVKLVGLDNSGHLGFIEQPDESLKALEDFFGHFGE